MDELWESQTRLMLCVVVAGLSKIALNLSSLVPKMYIYVSYILYASIQGIKGSGVFTAAATLHREVREE